MTHWALALVKGNREPHEAKKNSFDLGGNRTHDLQIRSTTITLPTELQGRTEKVRDDSELTLCSTICVPSAMRQNNDMYPYFLFAAIHHLNRPRLSLCDLVAQSAE